jgi:hypothetical protein
MIFRKVQTSWRIIALRHVLLYCSWQLMLQLCLSDFSFGGVSTPPFISKRGDVTMKATESVTTWSTLSLLVYFTCTFIDIIIYALGSTPWSSRIFWIVGQVVADPSLGLLSLCGVVPWVPILVTKTRLRAATCPTTSGPTPWWGRVWGCHMPVVPSHWPLVGIGRHTLPRYSRRAPPACGDRMTSLQ